MIRLSEMFENHMVFQQGKPVPVWGQSDREGSVVTAQICGKSGEGIVRNGAFLLRLPPLLVGGPYSLKVSCEDDLLLLKDVMVGEVWLAGGQSNMEMPLFAAEGAKEYLNRTDFSLLRLKTISRRSVSLEGEEYGFHFIPESSEKIPWHQADVSSAPYFSAIGCVVGQKLAEELKVPVGIISCNWGGTKVQPWVSQKVLKTNPVFAGDRERFFSRRQALGERSYSDWCTFQEDVKKSLGMRKDFVEKSLEDPLYYYHADSEIHWAPEFAFGDPNAPGCLYENMLSRVIPFGLRGILWYQGESSATFEDCNRYGEEMAALVDDWRLSFEDDSLYFVQIQLAAYDTSRRADPCDWAMIRQAQSDLCKKRKNVFLTNLMGISEVRNIHPRYKLEAGRRMANTVLAGCYHQDVPLEPEAVCALREGDFLRVLFRNASSLHISGEELQLDVGNGETFFRAEQYRLEGNSLLISTREHWVRYGYCPMPNDCLRNEADLGATPFLLREKE